MGTFELFLRFSNQAELEAELEENLRHGRAFAKGQADLAPFSRAKVWIEHPTSGARLAVDAEVVMVIAEGPARGTALQFLDRGQSALRDLAAFVGGQATRATIAHDRPPAPGEPPPRDHGDVDEDDWEGDDGDSADSPALRSLSKERQARMRDLPVAERIKVARGPILADRVLLERIYGNAVWEALLHNPKITIPEVARMARKGTLPRPLLDVIVDNEGWVRQSIVRRSLLGNPRLSTESALKVLRALPPRELKLVPQQTAYSALVRAAAQRLMRGG